jgi:hypothetical protein
MGNGRRWSSSGELVRKEADWSHAQLLKMNSVPTQKIIKTFSGKNESVI